MRDHNIIKWRMALAKASETDFEDHCTVFAGWRNAEDEVENITMEFSGMENCELRELPQPTFRSRAAPALL